MIAILSFALLISALVAASAIHILLGSIEKINKQENKK